MSATRRDYLEASFSLGGLIAENPILLREVENLVGNGFRGLELPRGVRVRARALITRIRKGAGAQAETKPAVRETKLLSGETFTAVFETLPAFDETEKLSTSVCVAELADAPAVRTPTGTEGSNPSANDPSEAA